MKYLDYINAFWHEAYSRPFSAGQIALYFAILDSVNHNFWQEWTSISLHMMACRIDMTVAGTQKAKEALVKRGIIDYRIGENGNCGEIKLLIPKKENDNQQGNVS